MSRLTWSDVGGAWGMDGVDLEALPPKVYAALSKLKDYEDAEECGKAPDSWEPPDLSFVWQPPIVFPHTSSAENGLTFTMEPRSQDAGGGDGETEA